MYKIDRRGGRARGGGGGAENGSRGNYPIFIISQNQNTLNISSF